MTSIQKLISHTILSVACGCSPKQSGQTDNELQTVIQEMKNPSKAIVAVSVTPAKSKDPRSAMANIENATIMSSCGYEIVLSQKHDSLVSPLNKYAYDSRWGAIAGNVQYYAGSVVAIAGFAAGAVLIGGSSAGGLVAPPLWYGIYPGLALMSATALAGGTLGASGENKLKENFEASYAFRELLSRTVYRANSHEYSARIETVKKAGNTNKLCPTLKVGELKRIAGISS